MSACWSCGAPAPGDRPGPRDVCDRCRSWLHCCRGCDFHEPGAHNDCREPNAEMVADKEQANFCDWFRPARSRPAAAAKADDARARLDRLFRK